MAGSSTKISFLQLAEKHDCGQTRPATIAIITCYFGSLSTCRVLSSSLLTCLHDFVHVPRWPNLENVAVRQRRMLRHQLYSMIHVPRLKDENAAELFLGPA
jgi:hypothetical protein